MKKTVLKTLFVFSAIVTVASSQAINRDIAYGSGPRQKLDLYLPGAKGFSTILFVHGGSLETGDKADDDYRGVCPALVQVGFACASINYRIFDTDTDRWPAPAEDTAAAIAWMKRSIGSHGGDGDKIFLFGHSSGARLVTLVATDPSYLSQYAIKPSDLRGVIALGTIMWDEEFEKAVVGASQAQIEKAFATGEYRWYSTPQNYLASWPMPHVTRALPPALVVVAEGERDRPPVLRHAQEFTAKMIKNGNVASYQLLPGRTHMTSIRQLGEPGDPLMKAIVDFTRNQLKTRQ